ncbi:putative S-adenosylmethionine-dependent methyltransferase At5g37990 [Senna tora]|uniref:Putative S-adenosylmethionine-dependent methyltransferase At5g37990 n=1 Tax=Senna tora TaxID=362788 RepID=A0A834SVX4_9FABA|nr:putative S-adenosylmethionine-dependent methyltransferase At5g37990 [Senna tora]
MPKRTENLGRSEFKFLLKAIVLEPCDVTCSDGSCYIGEFKYGVKHGLGCYHFRNGDRYDGEYFGDKIHGFHFSFVRSAIEAAKKHVHGAITTTFDPKAISASSKSPIFIVDLGCSTGPNTFIAIQHIIEAIQTQYQSHNLPTPEFQVFFNDQFSNDFNTLFQKLPPNRNYFASGVPGSFHGRLFPRQSLHLVHSSASLNWISKLPEEISDRDCGAWNKGRIHYACASREVVEAYEKQFYMEFDTFLNARAEEIVSNGIMALQIACAHEGIDVHKDLYPGKDFDLLGSCFMDMAKLGLVSEEKVDTFNVPIYFPHLKDLKRKLESNEDFIIEKMESLEAKIQLVPNVEMYVSHRRAALEALIEKHFGEGVVDELFGRYTNKVKEFPEMMDLQNLKLDGLFVLLKRRLHP